MANTNIIVSAVSFIIVFGGVIGLLVSVISSNSPERETELSNTSKAVANVCKPTDYKNACVASMFSVVKNQSATPKDYIKASFNFTIFKVKEALIKIGGISTKHNATLKMAMGDCKDLLQYAIDELEQTYAVVRDNEMRTVKEREDELKSWLSAVISYYGTCLDGVTQPEMNNELTVGLQNVTQLSSNCLAIVSSLTGILETFHITLNTSATSRRLLDMPETDKSGFPPWLSAPDRKLLASKNSSKPEPDAIVAQDGSGQYKTVGAALAAYPKRNKMTGERYVIYVKAGIYPENVKITKDQINVYMYGDGPRKTIITSNRNFNAGVPTFQTATFTAIGTGFICRSMGFQNTAGPLGHQAVALRVQSDMSAFYNCRMDGYQDTLYTQAHRQFYRNCVISGTIDFIFGDASAIIQNSLIIVRKPLDGQKNMVTAQGRTDKREVTGLVIQNCKIVPEQLLFPVRFRVESFLGRPWKLYSRTVIMESTIGDFIQPAGWMMWDGTFALDTLFYAEYANKGPGANTDNRVSWKGYKVITNRSEALEYTPGQFIQASTWLNRSGAPYFLGLRN